MPCKTKSFIEGTSFFLVSFCLLVYFKKASSTARYTVSTVVTFVIGKNVEVATCLEEFPGAIEENHVRS